MLSGWPELPLSGVGVGQHVAVRGRLMGRGLSPMEPPCPPCLIAEDFSAVAPGKLSEAELGNSSYFLPSWPIKSHANLWGPCGVLMHYLMFKLGEASAASDIWILLTTAEIMLDPAEVGCSCHLARWLKPGLEALTRRTYP